tara:strand:+ start:653 stop:1222 length:570 start_codon:yes stop_codon:yes gene_type:complete
MWNLAQDAGVFIYPLGICSIVGILVIFERLFALRHASVLPYEIKKAETIQELEKLKPNDSSIAGKICLFSQSPKGTAEDLKAFARIQADKMERGLFILEIIISVAPLIGLMGTVLGLVQVFSQFSVESGLENPEAFIKGVALALTTTVLGLSIAIPALVGNYYLNRKIDHYLVHLNGLVERLLPSSQAK